MEKSLRRNNSNKIIAGVCSGIADYFNTDPMYIRIAVIVICFFFNPAVIAYVLLALFMPDEEGNYIYKSSTDSEYNSYDLSNSDLNVYYESDNTMEDINPDSNIPLDIEYTNFDNNESENNINEIKFPINDTVENTFEHSKQGKSQNPFEMK